MKKEWAKFALISVAIFVALVMFLNSVYSPQEANAQSRNGTVVYQNGWSRVVRVETNRRYCYLAEKKNSLSGNVWIPVDLECP